MEYKTLDEALDFFINKETDEEVAVVLAELICVFSNHFLDTLDIGFRQAVFLNYKQYFFVDYLGKLHRTVLAFEIHANSSLNQILKPF